MSKVEEDRSRRKGSVKRRLSCYFVGFVCSTQSVVSHRSLLSRVAREQLDRFQSNLDFSSLKRHASVPNFYIMPGVVGIYLVAKLCASGRVARFSRKMCESCELIEVVVVGLVSPFIFFHFWEEFKISNGLIDRKDENGLLLIVLRFSSILFPIIYISNLFLLWKVRKEFFF